MEARQQRPMADGAGPNQSRRVDSPSERSGPAPARTTDGVPTTRPNNASHWETRRATRPSVCSQHGGITCQARSRSRPTIQADRQHPAPPIDWGEQLQPLTLLPSQVRQEAELCGCMYHILGRPIAQTQNRLDRLASDSTILSRERKAHAGGVANRAERLLLARHFQPCRERTVS